MKTYGRILCSIVIIAFASLVLVTAGTPALPMLTEIRVSPAHVLSVCELSKDFTRFNGRMVTVRGVYYYGIRQKCPQKCPVGIWPSFIDVVGGEDSAWRQLAKVASQVEAAANQSNERFEIWVTAVGRLDAPEKLSPLGPCDHVSQTGLGHLGAFPAQLVVTSFRDIEVKKNPQSPYDYAHMYHGPA